MGQDYVVQSSILFKCPPEILEDIALELALLNPVSLPRDLFHLNQTCKQIRAMLNFSDVLSARIFKTTFDLGAPSRRLGSRCSRPRNLREQLFVNYRTLAAIQRGDVYSPYIEPVFWQAFLMLIENDGKNRAQLEAAGLEAFAHRFICERLSEGCEDQGGWPLDNTINALALWIKSLTMTAATLASETLEEREKFVQLIIPYVIVGFRYASAFLPCNHFNVPLDPAGSSDEIVESVETAHGPYPIYRDDVVDQLCRFGCTFEIGSPLITIAAKHLYFAYRALKPMPIPTRIDDGDINEINAHNVARLYDRGRRAQHVDQSASDHVHQAPSLKWDHTWQTLVGCWDPVDYGEPSPSPVYTFGALNGVWAGKMLVPTIEPYLALVTTPYMPEGFSERKMGATVQPLFMSLREHHCVSPNTPLPGVGSALFEAWMPGVTKRVTEDALYVSQSDTLETYHCYETYEPGKRNSHDDSTCGMCAQHRAEEQRRLRSGACSPSYDMDTDSMPATPFHTMADNNVSANDIRSMPAPSCRGILDVILTGKSDEQRASVWGAWQYCGRVRPWDGLVVIARMPPAGMEHLGRLVFAGYFVGGENVIGTWRLCGAYAGVPTWEGAFTMSRIAT